MSRPTLSSMGRLTGLRRREWLTLLLLSAVGLVAGGLAALATVVGR